ncbi:MAG: inorganic diphosphatase, partial [Bacteroidota bacterium]
MIIWCCCTQCRSDSIVDPQTVAATTDGVVNMIVEIPAGTNRKVEFDYEMGIFKTDQKNGKDRIIDFLPYPGNYGFVPGTLMDKARGGDGDALDILVLSEAQPTGSLLSVRMLGALVLRDRGEIDTKL